MKINHLKRGGAIALAISSASILLSANAGQQTLLGISSTNTIAASATNTYAISDAGSAFTNGITAGGAIGGDTTVAKTVNADACYITMGGYFANTGGASNVIFRAAQSYDLAFYTNGIVGTVIVPAASTNWQVVQIQVLHAPPGMALRAVENSNNLITGTNLFFRITTKGGI